MLASLENVLFGVYSFNTVLTQAGPDKVVEKFEEILKNEYSVADPYDLSNGGKFFHKAQNVTLFSLEHKICKIIDKRTGLIGLIQRVYVACIKKIYKITLSPRPFDLWRIFTRNVYRGSFGNAVTIKNLASLYAKLKWDPNPILNKFQNIHKKIFFNQKTLFDDIEEIINHHPLWISRDSDNSNQLEIRSPHGNWSVDPFHDGLGNHPELGFTFSSRDPFFNTMEIQIPSDNQYYTKTQNLYNQYINVS